MPWWYYKGRVTTPVDIPGSGPTVIRPRMTFQAPLASVVHLKRIGMVVPCRPPKDSIKVEAEPPQPPREAPEPKNSENGDALGLSAVVASGPSEPEARVEVVEREHAVDEAEAVEMQEQEQEEEKKRHWRKKHR